VKTLKNTFYNATFGFLNIARSNAKMQVITVVHGFR